MSFKADTSIQNADRKTPLDLLPTEEDDKFVVQVKLILEGKHLKLTENTSLLKYWELPIIELAKVDA